MMFRLLDQLRAYWGGRPSTGQQPRKRPEVGGSGPPLHPILNEASRYDLVAFCLHVHHEVPDQSFIDLTLRRETEEVCLRFFRVRQLRIEIVDPAEVSGIVILDRSKDWLETIRVEVVDSTDDGLFHFFADSVERL